MKLIDADELWEMPLPTPEEFTPTDGNMVDFLCGMEWAGKVMQEAPSVDPVHIAGGCYCKECEYYLKHPSFKNEERRFCFESPLSPKAKEPDDFCSGGKKAET